MPHHCGIVDREQRTVRWIYPERLPNEPFLIISVPCSCGLEVRLRTVPVHSYLGRRLQAAHQERIYNNANQALAGQLANNYGRPPLLDDDLENNNGEVEDQYLQQNEGNRQNQAPILPRPPNLLAPVWDEWLANPENFDDEPLENPERENLPIPRFECINNFTNSDDECDAER